MTDFSTAPDASRHFGDVHSKHHEALAFIARAHSVVSDADIRNEAMRSLVGFPVELGYSRGPEARRVSYGALAL